MSSAAETEISLVRDDLPFRVQRWLGLMPREGSGVARRALVFSLLAWLPLAVWALWTHRALPGPLAEPLLAHFGIHTRFLLALPALILGEAIAHATTTRLVPQFEKSGLIPEHAIPAFREVIHGIVRLRNAVTPWIAIAILMLCWFAAPPSVVPTHELVWAQTPSSDAAMGKSGFGVWWYRSVSRPLFQLFLFAWLWRLILLAIFFRRLSKLELQIAPLHPDGCGGLGFAPGFLTMFAPFAFACSMLLAGQWAHDVVYHDAHAPAFKTQAIVFAVAMLLLCMSPLLMFAPRLAAAKRKALLEYGTLVGKHSRLVHQRWILGQDPPDADVLTAPEIGPVADVTALFDSVKKMRVFPITRGAILAFALPMILPILAVFAMDVPIGQLLKTIAGTVL